MSLWTVYCGSWIYYVSWVLNADVKQCILWCQLLLYNVCGAVWRTVEEVNELPFIMNYSAICGAFGFACKPRPSDNRRWVPSPDLPKIQKRKKLAVRAGVVCGDRLYIQLSCCVMWPVLLWFASLGNIVAGIEVEKAANVSRYKLSVGH